MQSSPRLGLSYLQPQQAQKHVTANETFRRLDALIQLSVTSATTAVEPSSPVEGDVYILPASPSGAAWGAFSPMTVAAFQDGAWVELEPGVGWRAYVQDAGQFMVFDGAAWTNEAALGAEASLGKLTIKKAGFLDNYSIADGSYQTFAFENYSSTVWHQTYLQARRGRGSQAAPAAVQNGDSVFTFDMYGHDGTQFVRFGTFGFQIAGTVSTGVLPGSARFQLADSVGVLRQILTISSSKVTVDGTLKVKSYAKASLPSAASEGAGAILHVSDEAGGAVLAFSDGASWRRVTDRAVVS